VEHSTAYDSDSQSFDRDNVSSFGWMQACIVVVQRAPRTSSEPER